ncbi:hypothetical protein KEH51_06055 [[Brevibacterium] frigoritolerans]|uniref:Uncharacterized protein n=1 Tax=Peribacillus frigoritolerans TaxID=450367 RepID=A0A941FJ49_9BACI|nr:hypothetical protein [Peribacillus frigoritolerans]
MKCIRDGQDGYVLGFPEPSHHFTELLVQFKLNPKHFIVFRIIIAIFIYAIQQFLLQQVSQLDAFSLAVSISS